MEAKRGPSIAVEDTDDTRGEVLRRVPGEITETRAIAKAGPGLGVRIVKTTGNREQVRRLDTCASSAFKRCAQLPVLAKETLSCKDGTRCLQIRLEWFREENDGHVGVPVHARFISP